MKQAICVLLVVFLMPATVHADEMKKPGELTDPLEIVKKVDEASKAVKVVKYDAVAEGGGAMAARVGKFEATYVTAGYIQGAPEKYFVDAKITLPNATEPRRVTAGTDNDMFYIIDHANKIAYEDIDPAVLGPSGRTVLLGMMVEFVHPTPFTDEIQGRSRELRGSQNIGGVDCYEVHVVYAAERAPEGTWCFSKKDFLPRRRIDHYSLQDGQTGTITKTITNLEIDPKVDKTIFKLKLPEGYTKTDDFAPNLFPQPQG
ncbi:MAG: hypothetical protein JSU63_02805 [Phycisphaerales bacterium]|nr:MAG: hypothetical protein JSU63_02805 [Phycisphaerales bacterium]